MAIGWRNQYSRYREFYLNIVNLYKQKADLRAFLEIILSLSTIIVFSIFALKPTALTIIALVREIKEKEITVAGLTKKVSDLEEAGNVYVQNQELIPIIDTAISTLPSPQEISMQAITLASKNSVEIMGISVGQITLTGPIPAKKGKSEFKTLPNNAMEMPFSISVRGVFPNIQSFLKDFENLRLTTKVDILGINSSNTEDGRIIVAIISGRAPYLGSK